MWMKLSNNMVASVNFCQQMQQWVGLIPAQPKLLGRVQTQKKIEREGC